MGYLKTRLLRGVEILFELLQRTLVRGDTYKSFVAFWNSSLKMHFLGVSCYFSTFFARFSPL